MTRSGVIVPSISTALLIRAATSTRHRGCSATASAARRPGSDPTTSTRRATRVGCGIATAGSPWAARSCRTTSSITSGSVGFTK